MNEHTCDLCGQPIATYRSKCPCVSNLIARVRQLEQDADPRTATGAALDRWARVVGLTDREPGETDGELRMRFEYEEPELSCGRRGGKSAALGTAIHEAIAAGYLDASSIPRHMLAGTEPAGLNAPWSYMSLVGIDRAASVCTRCGETDSTVIPGSTCYDCAKAAAYERLEPIAALAIGTRVRVDDRASPMHDREGRVQAYGPGGEIEVVFDGWPGAHGFHRAALALVDDTLPECPGCGGEGSIPLFTGVSDCPACGGSGVVG